ncbi:hypothetical protein GGR55DRAFT_639396 [Xylaria sp. FL0064]|nr:hypothetical protein GGR55DRAFT_639396 [Xylaria sp. FL0064]
MLAKVSSDTPLSAAMMAKTSGGGGTVVNAGVAPKPANPPTLQTLPTEILANIIYQMDPEDKIRMAFNFPNLFMNSGRFHVFIDDAHRQLNIKTWVPMQEEFKARSRPLFHDVIAYSYDLERIRQALDFYQEVASRRLVSKNVFLDSDFPVDTPQSLPPVPVPSPQSAATDPPSSPESRGSKIVDILSRRQVFGPLHIAIGCRRLDVVRYLLEQGARPHHSLWGEDSPLRMTLSFVVGWPQYFVRFDPERKAEHAKIAFELAKHCPTFSAYDRDNQGNQGLTQEFDMALISGLEPIVLLLLERGEAENDELDDQARQIRQASKDAMLDRMLYVRWPVPQALRLMLERGSRFTHCRAFIIGTAGSLTEAALGEFGSIENALVAFRWEIETQDPTLLASVSALTALAVSDSNIDKVKRFTRVAVELNYREAQQRFLLNAMHAGEDAVKTCEWLLENTSAGDAVALRYAILLFDTISAGSIIRRLVDLGQDIDAPLPLTSHHSPTLPPEGSCGYWYESALTFALSTRNYHAAAQLLSAGATPEVVPPNVRHRVRVVRDRINAGIIDNPAFYVYRVVLEDGTVPIGAETDRTLNYVFARMLDDPNFPLPLYVRQTRHQDLPADHVDNDSSDNDDL